ncbi:MAG: exodeoxyribonuclease III [Gammaproteobacteria bacterium]|nr:MAG: exodeoxyribonuclease III [Gammaproteobacteria bacterium]
MRIITANLNGIRAAARKGFFVWLSRQRADVVCLQETKAQEHQLTDPVFHPRGWHIHFHDAVKKGYSGTALYSRPLPDTVQHGIGIDWIDEEGRYLEARYGNLSVISLYLPSGTSGDERQAYKYRVMDVLLPHLDTLQSSGRDVIVCGDWNIAHTEADIRNWKGNLRNSGFLPEERQWLTRLFDEVGYVDVFRQLPQKPHEYTWWSQRGGARERNVGWRIDYQIVSASLGNRVRRTRVYRKQAFSDHAPLIIDYDLEKPASPAPTA